jgi:hypothetical protein
VTLRPAQCPAPDGDVLRAESYLVTVFSRFVSAQIPTPGALGWGLVLKFLPEFVELGEITDVEYREAGQSSECRLPD